LVSHITKKSVLSE